MARAPINIAAFWVVELPLGWFLAYVAGWGPDGVFVAIAFAYSLAAVLAFLAAPDADAEDVEVVDSPVIIAETTADIPEASVADAVMMLDLRDTNAMLFKNAGTGRHNMVYRRRDGSIGWVEPRTEAAA